MRCSCWAAGVSIVVLGFGVGGLARAGVMYADPGWDLIYEGDADDFGVSDQNALDGNWRHDQSDKWDGSAPGEVGPPPDGASPGGVVALVEDGISFLRLQDTGNPEQEQPDGVGGFTTPWSGTSNRRFYFGHDIEAENPGATSVLANGITLSFRARIASTGVLDDVYPDFLDTEGEIPDLQEITPWLAGSKGYNVKDDGKGMFTVQQDGADAIGFALALDFDTRDGIGSGLIMNNQGDAFLPGTDRAAPDTANLIPISGADLLDWHEFWITIEGSDSLDRFNRAMFTIRVFRDGSSVPVEFEVMNSFGAEFPGQFVTFGLPSTTSFGALDVDFYAYKLGVHDPEVAAGIPVLPAGGAVGIGLLLLALGCAGMLRNGRRDSA